MGRTAQLCSEGGLSRGYFAANQVQNRRGICPFQHIKPNGGGEAGAAKAGVVDFGGEAVYGFALGLGDL